MTPQKSLFARLFPFSWRDLAVSAAILSCAAGICIPLQRANSSDGFASPVFVLAVLCVSRFTTGYLFGLIASVLGVVCVNFIFTYPYWAVNFTLSGYPLTFLVFLAVSIMTCALTTQVRQSERLRAENEKEKMRANLLRAISHDLRTPLTSISGSISAVLENGGSLGETQCKELLQDAKGDADWLCRMVENLLSITRISGDDVRGIQKEDEALEEVLSEVVLNFRKKNPDVEVSVTVPDTLLFVPMDAMLIEQVVLNLLDNAVSHGKTTSKIRINASAGSEYATITVSDNGRGIEPAVMKHLFDGSLQLRSRETADNSRSMGIGLLLCRTIVEAHGGQISACNLPGGGASFTFTLRREEQ